MRIMSHFGSWMGLVVVSCSCQIENMFWILFFASILKSIIIGMKWRRQRDFENWNLKTCYIDQLIHNKAPFGYVDFKLRDFISVWKRRFQIKGFHLLFNNKNSLYLDLIVDIGIWRLSLRALLRWIWND